MDANHLQNFPATRAGEANAKDDDGALETPAAPEGAKILSLDQFRKKQADAAACIVMKAERT